MKACRLSRMRLFSSKFSKKTYTQRQHACMLLLMKKLRMHYRDVVELVEVMPDIMDIIGLKQIPHYTTLHKFFQRSGEGVLSLLMVCAARLSGISGVIAIDATGFSSNASSRYYMMIKYRQSKGVWRISYVKNSSAVDVKSQVVVALVCRNDHAHDSRDFFSLLKKAAGSIPVKMVIADRGYDFERIHEFSRMVMGIDTLIPVRRVKSGIVNGRFRKEMAAGGFDWKEYGKRSRIEGVFSVIKRRFGDTMYSRSWKMQKKEMTLLCAAYNVYRYVVYCLIVLEDFYRTV